VTRARHPAPDGLRRGRTIRTPTTTNFCRSSRAGSGTRRGSSRARSRSGTWQTRCSGWRDLRRPASESSLGCLTGPPSTETSRWHAVRNARVPRP